MSHNLLNSNLWDKKPVQECGLMLLIDAENYQQFCWAINFNKLEYLWRREKKMGAGRNIQVTFTVFPEFIYRRRGSLMSNKPCPDDIILLKWCFNFTKCQKKLKLHIFEIYICQNAMRDWFLPTDAENFQHAILLFI